MWLFLLQKWFVFPAKACFTDSALFQWVWDCKFLTFKEGETNIIVFILNWETCLLQFNSALMNVHVMALFHPQALKTFEFRFGRTYDTLYVLSHTFMLTVLRRETIYFQSLWLMSLLQTLRWDRCNMMPHSVTCVPEDWFHCFFVQPVLFLFLICLFKIQVNFNYRLLCIGNFLQYLILYEREERDIIN